MRLTLHSLFFPKQDDQYWLTRFIFLRFLGLVYFFAFFSIYWQFPGLIGNKGILPVSLFLQHLSSLPSFSSLDQALYQLPTLFWFNASNEFMLMSAFLACMVSLLVILGLVNGFILFTLWVLYFSFVQVGQKFYSFGWDILLCEAGLLAIFLVPFFHVQQFDKRFPPPKLIIYLFRFLAFRIMLGAGLIKLNAQESCWIDLTCLQYHYETQPIPNPLSWFLHQMPKEFHAFSVIVNHIVELIVPFFLLGSRKWRQIGALLTIVFQGLLILSGNLSFLNWLTLTLCFFCLDDQFFQFFLPKKRQKYYQAFLSSYLSSQTYPSPIKIFPHLFTCAFFLLNAVLAPLPLHNLLPPKQSADAFLYHYLGVHTSLTRYLPPFQRMNSSFNSLLLMNTYGAFGSVGKVRKEIVIYGTDEEIITPETSWKEYEFFYKPSSLVTHPPVIAPYQPRLDWQIWFAAMGSYERYPWFIAFISKLLVNQSEVTALIKYNPFSEAPPKFIKADLFIYEFTKWDEEEGSWWKRKKIGSYLPPLSLDNPSLKEFLKRRGYRVSIHY